jgi:hypothetical protein
MAAVGTPARVTGAIGTMQHITLYLIPRFDQTSAVSGSAHGLL